MHNLTPKIESTLIPVFTAEIGGVAMPVVNARDLHDFLELKSNYSDWIKKRVTVYKFIENEDFSLISENTEIKTGRGGDRRSIDCLLTQDMARRSLGCSKEMTRAGWSENTSSTANAKYTNVA